MDKQQVRETINQLVEANFDKDELPGRLEQFKQSNPPPRVPSQFETLQQFIDFHDQRQRYQGELQRLQTNLDEAKEAYKQVQETLKNILPEDVPLFYDYVGLRGDLKGTRYMIVHKIRNRRSDISISSLGGSI